MRPLGKWPLGKLPGWICWSSISSPSAWFASLPSLRFQRTITQKARKSASRATPKIRLKKKHPRQVKPECVSKPQRTSIPSKFYLPSCKDTPTGINVPRNSIIFKVATRQQIKIHWIESECTIHFYPNKNCDVYQVHMKKTWQSQNENLTIKSTCSINKDLQLKPFINRISAIPATNYWKARRSFTTALFKGHIL